MKPRLQNRSSTLESNHSNQHGRPAAAARVAPGAIKNDPAKLKSAERNPVTAAQTDKSCGATAA